MRFFFRSSTLNPTRIVFVGMLDSPHFLLWLNSTIELNLFESVWIFPSDRPKSIKKTKFLISRNSAVRIFRFPVPDYLNFALYFVLDNLVGMKWRSYFLNLFLKRARARIIHFHEMQHGAYIFNPISEVATSYLKSIKILSTWGSDLVLFSKIASHEDQIRKVMSWADILTAERAIEEDIANQFGFNGVFLCPIYITIGMPSESIKHPMKPPSQRNTIIIKGHLDFSGRALNALQAVSLLKSELAAFKIRVFSANPAVALEVEIMKSELKIDISTIPRIKKNELKEYFLESRLYLGISISDGLPGSMMEAMSAGCFPIQSKNSAASEFIQNGVSGFIVDEWDLNDIAARLLSALTDDLLVDKAALINQDVLINKFNYIDGLMKIENLYKKALLP